MRVQIGVVVLRCRASFLAGMPRNWRPPTPTAPSPVCLAHLLCLPSSDAPRRKCDHHQSNCESSNQHVNNFAHWRASHLSGYFYTRRAKHVSDHRGIIRSVMPSWYKVTLPVKAAGVVGEIMRLQNAFHDIFVRSTSGKDVALFTSHSDDFTEHFFYFSPGAAAIASALIAKYGGVPCSPPFLKISAPVVLIFLNTYALSSEAIRLTWRPVGSTQLCGPI